MPSTRPRALNVIGNSAFLEEEPNPIRARNAGSNKTRGVASVFCPRAESSTKLTSITLRMQSLCRRWRSLQQRRALVSFEVRARCADSLHTGSRHVGILPRALRQWIALRSGQLLPCSSTGSGAETNWKPLRGISAGCRLIQPLPSGICIENGSRWFSALFRRPPLRRTITSAGVRVGYDSDS